MMKKTFEGELGRSARPFDCLSDISSHVPASKQLVPNALEILRAMVSKLGGWTDVTVKVNYFSRQVEVVVSRFV